MRKCIRCHKWFEKYIVCKGWSQICIGCRKDGKSRFLCTHCGTPLKYVRHTEYGKKIYRCTKGCGIYMVAGGKIVHAVVHKSALVGTGGDFE